MKPEDDIDRIVFSGYAPAVEPISHLRKRGEKELNSQRIPSIISQFVLRYYSSGLAHLKVWRQFHEIEKVYYTLATTLPRESTRQPSTKN
jgi:hypothetical protein